MVIIKIIFQVIFSTFSSLFPPKPQSIQYNIVLAAQPGRRSNQTHSRLPANTTMSYSHLQYKLSSSEAKILLLQNTPMTIDGKGFHLQGENPHDTFPVIGIDLKLKCHNSCLLNIISLQEDESFSTYNIGQKTRGVRTLWRAGAGAVLILLEGLRKTEPSVVAGHQGVFDQENLQDVPGN